MNKEFIKDTFVWGFILWLIGFLLGIVLFPIVEQSTIGWIIMPIGIVITLWVLMNKINAASLKYYLLISVVWTLTAIICDYFLLVKVFKPTDGYYKLDVYLYYLLTFMLPLVVSWKKQSKVLLTK